MTWKASASSLASVVEALRVVFDIVALPIESDGVIGMTLLFSAFVVRRSVSPTSNVAPVPVPVASGLPSPPFNTSKPSCLPQSRLTSTCGVNVNSCSMVSMAVMIALVTVQSTDTAPRNRFVPPPGRTFTGRIAYRSCPVAEMVPSAGLNVEVTATSGLKK